MTPAETEVNTKAGFVAVIGSPNAGKSTLVNRLVGMKIAIVTHKVQTTRFPVRGVLTEGDVQMVLVDTPGIFNAKRKLERAMVRSARSGAEDADAIVHLVDASAWVAEAQGRVTAGQKHSITDDKTVMEDLERLGRKAFLALNKIDLFPHEAVLPLLAEFSSRSVYSEMFPISAANGDGVDRLKSALADLMPQSPFLFDPEQSADLPLRLLASEITREKLMLRLHDELPYQLTVETEKWEERKDGSVKIDQVIIVGRETHKGMVLGKQGRTVKEIGKLAREELSELFERPVHLFLFVKIDEKWAEKRDSYEPFGLDFNV